MYALRQDSCSVTEFFTKLKGFWEELELYRPVPDCTSTFRCKCEDMRNTKKFKEQDLVLLFLTGLNDHYAMKHGFPPGYRFKDRTLAVNKHHGHASAHYGQASANHVASEDHGGKNAVDNRIATFSSQEYQPLMALLKSNSQNAGEGTSQVNSITKVIASSYCNDKQGIGFTPLVLFCGIMLYL
ncbi:unnamed protein product [Trifolium pratense]|uniref:Uncharacterized protein n=1 Tax=Trifolium pratense TaxID=57577 RepID=A0ACB0IJ48_TRIPR|nr:unnamed protein product [Trifolium pratense]